MEIIILVRTLCQYLRTLNTVLVHLHGLFH